MPFQIKRLIIINSFYANHLIFTSFLDLDKSLKEAVVFSTYIVLKKERELVNAYASAYVYHTIPDA